MKDLATYDFGTYYPLIVPQPDEPVFLAWGSAIAWNMARITRGLQSSGNHSAATSQEGGISIQSYRPSAFPFIFWRESAPSTGTWSTLPFLGSGCTLIQGPTGTSQQQVTYFGTITETTVRINEGRLFYPYNHTTTFWGR